MVIATCPAVKTCTICKEVKPQVDFYIVRGRGGCKDILGSRRVARCKQCQNGDYVSLDPRTKMLYAARARANKLGVDFSITIDDIMIPEVCPILGIPLISRTGGGRPTTDQIPNSPSLDRVVNNKGYVPGNVAVISFRANLLKRDATIKELQAILDYMKSHTS